MTQIDSPKFSIVMPTYNRYDLIAQAIESVIAQHEQDWELIVVDDGSSDNTKEIVEKYRDNRIHYLYQENAGKSIARNRGIERARASHIVFLDSDDYWHPEMLSAVADAISRNPGAGLFYGQVEFIRECQSTDAEIKPTVGAKNFEELLNGDHQSIYTCATAIKKSCLEQVGVFDPWLLIAQDIDLWLRIAEKYPVVFIPKVVSYVRRHAEDSASNRLNLYEGYLRFQHRLVQRYEACLSRKRRQVIENYITRYQYLLGIEYLKRGDAHEALRRVQQAIVRDRCVGKQFIEGSSGIFQIGINLIKPYLVYLACLFQTLGRRVS
ncbi:MAG: glycosyltransferase [Candidatus Omnitrophica bacterium]|nr:glycosyltransferase [Candidatus Omnitrophota bacterium]